MIEETELMGLAVEASEAARKAGASHADIFLQDSREVAVEIEKNSIRTGDITYEAGYCVRTFHKGGTGFSRGSGLDRNRIIESCGDSFAMAKESEQNPDFKGLPHPLPFSDVSSLYSSEVADFSASEAIKWGIRCIDAAREIEPGVIVKGGFSAGASVSALANTNGVSASELDSFISFYVFSMVRRGDEVGSFYEYSQARRISDLKSPEEVARLATRRALSFLDSRKIESGVYPVILGPLSARDFIGGVIGAASAEEVQRGRSFLSDRRAKQIAPEILTVTEDPLFPAGIGSSPSDGEGFPRRKHTLISDGVLTTFLHNSYTAGKAGEENTGHAARGSFNSNISIGITNMSLKPGAVSEKDMLSGIKDGLYVFMGSIAPDVVTGQISGTVDFGFRILNGELAHPVENVMVGGNVFDFLSRLEAVSSDFREEPGNVMPSLLLGGISVASA